MVNHDDRSKGLETSTSDLATPSPQSQEEDWDICLVWGSDHLSRARFWISCSALVFLALASIGLWFVLQVAIAMEVWVVIATQSAVVVVYGIGGLIAWRVRDRVGKYLDDPDGQHLEEVFQAETDYWTYWGMLSLLALVGFGWLMLMLITGGLAI